MFFIVPVVKDNFIYILFPLICILISCSCKEGREEQLTICFTGDVLLDRGVREQIEKKGIEYVFKDVKQLFRSSDAVVINLECPVTDTVSPIHKRFIFRADSEWLPALAKNGITHAVLANNHSMDQGRRGLESTAYHLLQAGIVPVGYGTDHSSSCGPVFISKNGIEVALFSSVRIPLENWVYLEDKPAVCQATIESLTNEIYMLKNNKPDCYAIIVLHWGVEYQQNPNLQQRRKAHQLIDAGADAIIGHHPHVIQKEEYYKQKPIFYSLGNFVFDQNKPATTEGLLLRLNFTKNDIHCKKYIVDIVNCKPIIR